ncbi:MAG TPA: hypothetical protein VI814_12750 [Candidatus Limnocylindria bacterium]
MDALRAEFPGAFDALGSVPRIRVAPATMWDAFLAGVGAAFIVRAIALLAVAVLYPIAFPPTIPHPLWLTPALIAGVLAEFAAGVVLVRTGGITPLLFYVGLELFVVLAGVPGRLALCARVDPGLRNFTCDVPGMVADRWPMWLALALGAVAFRALALRDGGENTLLRAAGAFSLVITLVANVANVAFSAAGSSPAPLAVDGMFAVGQIVAGLVAGVLLWRAPLAAPVLLAICLVGPGFGSALPTFWTNLHGQVPNNLRPNEYAMLVWASLLIPLGGVVALFAGRAFRREWGTFF